MSASATRPAPSAIGRGIVTSGIVHAAVLVGLVTAARATPRIADRPVYRVSLVAAPPGSGRPAPPADPAREGRAAEPPARGGNPAKSATPTSAARTVAVTRTAPATKSVAPAIAVSPKSPTSKAIAQHAVASKSAVVKPATPKSPGPATSTVRPTATPKPAPPHVADHTVAPAHSAPAIAPKAPGVKPAADVPSSAKVAAGKPALSKPATGSPPRAKSAAATPVTPKSTTSTGSVGDASGVRAAHTAGEGRAGSASSVAGAHGRDAADVRVTGLQFPFPGYLDNLVRQVRLRFSPSQARAGLRADLAFVVARDGSVSGLRVVHGSGDYAFDLEAQGAVEAAGAAHAFGPLPDGFNASTLPVTFSFDPRTAP